MALNLLIPADLSVQSIRSLAEGFEDPEANQFMSLFIPKTERERFEAGEQRDRLDLAEHEVCIITLLQIVVGDAGA